MEVSASSTMKEMLPIVDNPRALDTIKKLSEKLLYISFISQGSNMATQTLPIQILGEKITSIRECL